MQKFKHTNHTIHDHNSGLAAKQGLAQFIEASCINMYLSDRYMIIIIRYIEITTLLYQLKETEFLYDCSDVTYDDLIHISKRGTKDYPEIRLD